MLNHMLLQGWKLAPARWPGASKFYVALLIFFSGLVKFPTISIQIMGFGSCRAGTQKVRFRACYCLLD